MRLKALEASNYQCIYCGSSATEADHIIPYSWEMKHELDNLVGCCRECNAIAYNLHFDSLAEKITYVQRVRTRRGLKPTYGITPEITERSPKPKPKKKIKRTPKPPPKPVEHNVELQDRAFAMLQDEINYQVSKGKSFNKSCKDIAEKTNYNRTYIIQLYQGIQMSNKAAGKLIKALMKRYKRDPYLTIYFETEAEKNLYLALTMAERRQALREFIK